MKKIFGTLFVLSVLFTGTFVLAASHTAQAFCVKEGGYWNYVSNTCVTSGGSGTVGSGGGSGTVGSGGGALQVGGPNAKLKNPINVGTFGELVKKVISAAVTVLMPFVVLAFVYSGFLFVKAQGKPEDIEKAKEAILYSVVGAFILLGAWGFAQIIGTTVRTITG